MSSVFILAACLIAAIKITPIVDEMGQPVLPNPEDEGECYLCQLIISFLEH
jgi:hypothetical protein